MLRLIKRPILAALNATGYRIEKIPQGLEITGPKEGYEMIRPGIGYAPWRTDPIFQPVYKKIRANTLVDEYRCYELWQLIPETTPSAGAFLEVGVWRGGTGALIAAKAVIENSEAPVYLADTFTGVVKTSEKDSTYRGGEHADVSFAEVAHFLHLDMKLEHVCLLKGIFPEETASKIPGNTLFRFCHIDVDAYQSTRDVMEWVWKRMVPGGIVVIDDYGFITCNGVTQFVDEELRGNPECRVIHNLNGHAIVIKII